MSQNSLTREKILEALAVNPHLSKSDLAVMFGVHRATIYRILQKEGMPKKPSTHDLLMLQKARRAQDEENNAIKSLARKLANAGFTLHEAQKIFEFFMTLDALSVANGNRTISAVLLDENRVTVIRRLEKLGFRDYEEPQP